MVRTTKLPNLEIETYRPQSRTDWRQWLEKNHQAKQSVWLVYYTKKSNVPSITWREAVDEALCFGWIDSTQKKIDDFSFMQFFTKRKPKSIWSKINKEKVLQLIDSKRMTKAGYQRYPEKLLGKRFQNEEGIQYTTLKGIVIPDEKELPCLESQKVIDNYTNIPL